MTDWATIVRAAQAGDSHADALAVVGALEVAANASDYAPQTMPDPPAWMANADSDRSAIAGWQVDQWALHRHQVTTREGENEGRLSALCWAIVALRSSAANGMDATARSAGDALARKVHRWYPRLEKLLMGRALPSSALERRPLVHAATLDLDALPRAWRDLPGRSSKERASKGERTDQRPKSEPTRVGAPTQTALAV